MPQDPPILNIDTNGDGCPDLNIDLDNDGIPVGFQSVFFKITRYPNYNFIFKEGKLMVDSNIDKDVDDDGEPDFNDPDGDGCPDLNIKWKFLYCHCFLMRQILPCFHLYSVVIYRSYCLLQMYTSHSYLNCHLVRS